MRALRKGPEHNTEGSSCGVTDYKEIPVARVSQDLIGYTIDLKKQANFNDVER